MWKGIMRIVAQADANIRVGRCEYTRSLMRLYVLALLAFCVHTAVAQDEPTTVVDPVVADSVASLAENVAGAVDKHEKKIHFINGAAVGADFVGPVMKVLGSDWLHMEVLGRINILDKYFPIAELGIGEAEREGRDIDNHFKVRSPYFRVGADYNFSKKHNGNRLMAGLRYGFAKYTYDFDSSEPLIDPYWQTSEPFQLHDLDGRCHWAEVVFGLETRLWTIVHLGWDVRIKFKVNQKRSPVGEPWYIPGYGKTGGSTCWGGSFKLLFDI